MRCAKKSFFIIRRRQLAACQRLKCAFHRGSLGYRSWPGSTTANHSVSLNWTHNLPVERRTP